MMPTSKKALWLSTVAATVLLHHSARAQSVTPGAGTLAISPYANASPLTALTNALQAANSGITITSSSFIGANSQSGTYSGFALSSSVAGKASVTAPNGVLLTTGTANIPLTNTSPDFSNEPNTGSSADLSALSQSAGGTSVTYDQNVLTLTFTVNDPAKNAVSAQFIYGSEEYPHQNVTDIFGFFVDGHNYAAFPDGSLVSFKGSTAGFFNDNSDGSYPIEYNGISNLLTVNGLLDSTLTQHTLEIAIADTADNVYDSGVFIGNLQSAAVSGGGGVVTSIDTAHGDIAANIFSLSSPAATGGTVEFDGGTLRMTGGAFPGNVIGAPVTIDANNGTIDTSTGSGGFSGTVSGPGSLTIAGGGTFSLTGANSYAGGTILNASTVTVGNGAALGTGPVTFNAGTLQTLAEGLVIGNAATLAGNGTIDTQGFGLTYTGTIAGAGQLTKIGSGTLALTAANSYTGGTALNAGAIAISNGAALGTGPLTFGGGALQAGVNGLTVTNAATLASNATIDTQAFGLTYAGTITGAGQLTKIGAGSLALNAANSYAGGTVLNAGSVVLGNGAALGTGTLTFAGGALQAGADALTVNNAATLASNATIDTQAFALTYAGSIAGTGQLTKLGAGALALAANNSYSGGTLLTNGTVVVDAPVLAGATSQTPLGTGTLLFNGGTLQNAGTQAQTLANAIQVNASGGVIDANGQGLTLLGNIANGLGAGSLLFKNSAGVDEGGQTAGVTTLSGANTFTGGATIQSGAFVVLGADNAIGAGSLDVEGELDLGTSSQAVTQLTGAGAIISNRAFGPNLSGTDVLTVQSGLYTGVISDNAPQTIRLVKTSSGVLALTGANSYAGGTEIDAGTLTVGGNSALGTGALSLAGGTLQVQQGLALTLANAVAVTAAGGTIDANRGGLTLSGNITGAGALTFVDGGATPITSNFNGTNSVVLSGVNTYTGGSTVRAATNVILASSNALGAGPLQIDPTGSVDLDRVSQTITRLTGSGTLLATASGQAANTTSLSTLTVKSGAFSGAINTGVSALAGGTRSFGDITLVKASDGTASGGTLTLLGASTYGARGGSTLLQAGTLAVGNASALGSGALVISGGTLQAAAGVTLANAVILAGTGTVDTQAFASGFGLSGVISGTGTLVKIGSSSLDLGGANTYAGGTVVGNGLITVRNTAALGTGLVTFAGGNLRAGTDGLTLGNAAALAGDASIDTQAFGLTYAGGLTGAGGLTKLGTGTLILTGTSTYGGGTTIAAGTLQIGTGGTAGSITGDVADSGTLAFNRSDSATFEGAITGPGSLLQSGPGTLALTGANSYSGGTVIAAGTLQIGTGGTAGSITGNVTDNGTLIFNRSDDTTFAGTIAGAGAVIKTGTGALTLPGANSYAGGTTLLAGTLAIGDSAALGTGPLSMDEGTTLLFAAPDLTLANAITFSGLADPTIDTGSGNQTISGPIAGPGALTKLGSGTLDLTAVNTYAGATTVAAGTLLVDGSIANSGVTVEDGAALGGGGTIGSLIAQSGSRIVQSAGKALTILGNVTFASGSTYQVTINGDGTAGQLSIGGSATLNSAKLAILAGTGEFKIAQTYTLLTAPGGVSGTFGSIDASSLALLVPSVTYTADSVLLSLHQQDFTIPAVTGNQIASAGAIQSLGPTSPLYNAVAVQDEAGARQAFNATSGVSQASTTTVTRSTNMILTGLMIDRLWDVGGSGLSARQVLDQFSNGTLPGNVNCYGPADPAPAKPATYTAWGEGFGSFGHSDGGANAGSLDRSLGGFVVGIDTPLSGPLDKWRAGVASGYTNTSFTSHLDGGSGTVQGVFGSLYGGARYGAVDIRLGTTVTGTSTDSVRRVAFPGFLETEQSSYGGLAAQGFVEVGYRIPFSRAVLEPVAGAAVLHVHQDGFTETGGAAALVGSPEDNDLGTTTLGVRGEAAPLNGVPLLAHAFLGWQHTIGNISPVSTLAFAAGGNPFTVSGNPIDRDALAASAALDYRTTAALDIGMSYTGLVGPTATEHSVKGRVEYRF